jgi:Uma2 family endonuclease
MTITPGRMIPIPEPPSGGFTIADLDDLDDLGHHVELISGGIHVSARGSTWHKEIMLNLWRALADQAPAEYVVSVEQGVKVDDGTRPEPDVLAIRTNAIDPDANTYAGDDVVLAVEIVSPGSERRDRRDKPPLYAEAGIVHFWLIEREGDKPVAHTYELDESTHRYVATGIHRETMTILVPWPLTVDLTQLAPTTRRSR